MDIGGERGKNETSACKLRSLVSHRGREHPDEVCLADMGHLRGCLLLIPYLGYGIEADNAPVHCLVHQHVQPEKAMVHVAVDASLVSFQE